jgi:predicted RNA-binding protein associated with RNAse of E/G family
VVDEAIVLEVGAPVVWFTFPGKSHDIGRFHLRDGSFTGLYANIVTPVDFENCSSTGIDTKSTGQNRLEWRTTDLYLDLWLGPAGEVPVLLDEAELSAAVAARHIGEESAATARREAVSLLTAWHEGTWPPPIVNEWTLERARAATNRHNDATASVTLE